MTDSSQAPHGLDLVIEFVNTLDIEKGTDALATPHDLGGWLVSHALMDSRESLPSKTDRQRAIQLREALRGLMLSNNGGTSDGQDASELENAARRGQLGVHFAPAGGMSLAASREGVDGALAQLLVPVAQAISDGSWRRVKACPTSDCQWAFYDHSRNRSGVWCDMAVCGNRTKVRAYRERAPATSMARPQ